ncbi:polyhydroxyalkanoate depolymerase [Beijerinckia indica]|uniref:Polyhydroxyalkanoate depolymerase, intracellular n=1 Tax=Beijerinckia indica subsp. indica (strain ATCC 9039 / DSM 1715 / NCIMB 8712) TaxID=395963 RepID=B2IEJ0_BEII9|nr:polyhydroxyalkanoate depolymerase [Beijerinckia indica]ACB95583.1 polyhydroxyalkanoate depolymerase, intracellular [Beijerinckia indica subsp. indica ATCC 9039]
MIYQTYEVQENLLDLLRPLAATAGKTLRSPYPGLGQVWPASEIVGILETFANLSVTHVRRPFAINSVLVGDRRVPVTEEIVASTPFATLLHFKKETNLHQQRVLVVAPMSGHFATLLRAMIETVLADHDVYITDWHNARDVPLSAGRFDLSTFVDHVIDFLRMMGARSHVIAVCQPCVPVLAAAALMNEDKDDAQPSSMTLMAGPIDTRINPTKVNALATQHPIAWFEQHLTDKVPLCYKGARRDVYPGFLQLTAFMSMNWDRHLRAFKDMAEARVANDLPRLQAIQTFYDEYLTVMDLPAELYLQTIQLIFQDHALPRGKLTVHGRPINPKAIKHTALMTVEGERDDICGLGQTLAAQELCSGLKPYMKFHHVQMGVGHYGVFAGRRWSTEIYPRVRYTIQMTS